MSDSDLYKSLSALPVPEVDLIAREQALQRALMALGQPTPEPARPRSAWRYPQLAFGLLALLLLAGGLGFHFGQRKEGDLTAMAQTLREIETLFPGQLDAIVEEEGETRLQLAATPHPSGAQPVYVELRRGSHRVRIISYSGRRVTLLLGDKPVTFEPLLTGSGEVILVGEDFIWPKEGGRYQIRAYSLSS